MKLIEQDITLGWRFVTRENEGKFLPTDKADFPSRMNENSSLGEKLR
jgi:hypothetical protein